MSRKPKDRGRNLIEHAAGPGELGPPSAMLATTYDLAPDFVECDFLPTIMRVGAADDRSFRSRMQLEEALSRTQSVAILCDARCFRGRPASLRVHVAPSKALDGGYLHAKVTLLVYEDAVRLLVGSANLTTSGYRANREVAFAIQADKKALDGVAIVRHATASMRRHLDAWWTDGAEEALVAAERVLAMLPQTAPSSTDRFAWSGPSAPLVEQVVGAWPVDEEVQSIRIVSPFWSDEGPSGGPISSLLSALRERTKTRGTITVQLVAAASPMQGGVHLPVLPAGFRDMKPREWGAKVEAVAAQPYVGDDDDVPVAAGARGAGGVSVVERRLHAKVVLIEGKATTLAYAGSANFTGPGWGFAPPTERHVEAGVILERKRTARDALRRLIPPLAGTPIELGASASVTLALQPPEEPPAGPWPAFLREARLVPRGGHDVLELELRVAAEEVSGTWGIALDEAATEWKSFAPDGSTSRLVPLDADQVLQLVRRKAIQVRWRSGEETLAANFPVNVAQEARAQIPFGDGTSTPREHELIAFFQGRIGLADVFPPPPESEVDESEPEGETWTRESGVDTSDILSYKVRAFVEALPGMREQLERDSSTPATLRSSILGPVSPLALAKEIHRAAIAGRSPIAAGFQLVELRRLLRGLRSVSVPELSRTAWNETLLDADARIGALLDEVRARAGGGASATFDRYVGVALGGAS